MAGKFVRLLVATVATVVLMPACYSTDYNNVAPNQAGVVIPHLPQNQQPLLNDSAGTEVMPDLPNPFRGERPALVSDRSSEFVGGF